MRGTTLKDEEIVSKFEISTHVPHAGHDSSPGMIAPFTLIFQLTCPMRGTTPIV